jgi:hypothetical protein
MGAMGMETNCQSMGQQCFFLDEVWNPDVIVVHCSPTYQGGWPKYTGEPNFTYTSSSANGTFPIFPTWFEDPSLSTLFLPGSFTDTNTTLLPSTTANTTSPPNIAKAGNPLYAAIAGSFFTNDLSLTQGIVNDPSFIYDWTNLLYVWFILNCSVSAFNLTYTVINGSFTSVVLAMLPPEQAAPYFQTSWYTSPGAALTTAGVISTRLPLASESGSIPGFMSNMESSLRTTLAGFGSPIMDPLRNVKEQTREQKLVAQVPLPPLWFLVALCMLYTMLGLLVSLFTLRDCSPSARDIRDRLSVKGVVANCCRVPRYDLPNLDVSESFFA